MIARPMPVASSTQPSSTNTGTDTSTRLDMPSSMRPIITPIGMWVVKARKLTAPMPKQNAIGTAATRHTATKPIRKITMLRWPRSASTGMPPQQAPATAATAPVPTASCASVQVRQACVSTTTSIATMPKAIAATRQLLGISSAGVVTKASDSTYSNAGCTSASRNTAVTISPKACT